MLRNAFDQATFATHWSSTPNPAAGNEATIGALAAAESELVLMSFTLVTDANVANRLVYITLETGGIHIVLGHSGIAHTATATFRYIVSQHATTNAAGNVGAYTIPLPEFRNTDPTATLKINVDNIQAGDQLSLIITGRRLWGH